MKALVIGGAGYIGSHVVLALTDKGYDVTIFDNLSTGTTENITSTATFIKGDIVNYDQLASAMSSGFDAIFHFAALKAPGESMTAPQRYSLNNICGSLNVLNAAVANNIKYIVFSSTAAVYGEPSYIPLDENHPLQPENYYGFTKLEIERILSWYDRLCGINYAILRYFNAAGYDIKGRICGLEKNPQNLLPAIMEVATGKREKLFIFGNDYPTPDGTGIRDYIHVNDLAQAHILSLEYLLRTRKSLTINLGSESGFSVKEMVNAAIEITGKPIPTAIAPRRPGDCASVYATSHKAKHLLGWEPCYSDINTIIKSMWNSYQSKLS